MSAEQTSLAPILDFLRLHAPFSQMAPAHLEFLAKRLTLGFYPKGQVVIGPDSGPADCFYIIKQGRIRGESPEAGEESAWELVAGEGFPIGALLSHRPVLTVNRAVEDTFCYELRRADFEQLLLKSPVFHDFCTRRLASLLDSALRGVQASSAAQASEDRSLNTPLRSLLRRSPVTCAPETPLRQALQRLRDEEVGSIAVTEGGRPVGMFTLHDVLSRVVLAGIELDSPISRVMSPSPLSLKPDSLAYEAALLMAREGFGHVCVVENGRLIGVLSEKDLFSLQRIGLVNLSQGISQAPDVERLARLEQDVHKLIEQMLAQGASVGQLTEIITALNDHLTRRVIELVLAESGPLPPFTWLSFGSEGRGEQTLKTDQDNGIIFIPPEGMDAEQVRATLLPVAKRINDALDRCGFPLCPGNIMAGNPECCLSFDEWRLRFARWIDQGTPEHLLKATIFFDFRPLWGDPKPAEALWDWLGPRVEHNSRFRRQMAENALRNRPPLGLFRDFKVSGRGEHPNSLDLKVKGVTPFVDGARLFALATRSNETNTVERLQAAARAGALNPADVDAWIEAYHFVQLLRMQNHRAQAERNEPLNNYVDPDTLNELDRRILKEAFRQARKLQSKIALEYQL